jgi:hypothetical protein
MPSNRRILSAVSAPGEAARILCRAAQGVGFVDGFLIFGFGSLSKTTPPPAWMYSVSSFRTAVRSAMQKSISPLAAK